MQKAAILILTSSLMIWSCKKGPELGLQVQPGEDVLNSTYIDTLSFVSQVQLIDSIRTDNLTNSRSLVGIYNDPIFGKTNAAIVAQPTLSKLNLVFETDLVIDSVFLELSYSSIYGDSNSSFTVNVKQLSDRLYKNTDTAYYSNDVFNTFSQVIGTKSFSGASLSDSIPTIQRINNKDTLIKIAPQLRIPIDKNFIQSTIIGASSEVFTSIDTFAGYIKGFSIEVDSSIGISGQGFIAQLDLFNNNKSALNIYYHTASDTAVHSFPINSTCAVANTFGHTYSSTVLMETNKDFGMDNPIHLQTMGGVQTAIKIPYLKNLPDSIFIHKAELELALESGTNVDIKELPRIALVRKDSTGRFLTLPDGTLGDAYSDGFFITGRDTYILNCTRYVQDVLQGIKDNETLYILPLGSGSTANRSVVKSFSQGSKLKLYYTKIK
jgi:hypothetical protein